MKIIHPTTFLTFHPRRLLLSGCLVAALIVCPLIAHSDQMTNNPSPVTQSTLTDALDAAIKKGLFQARPGKTSSQGAYRWLAASPSISVNYIDSREQLGSNETELSLNLPLKSLHQHQADKRLRALTDSGQEQATVLQALYYSGLIRKAIWSYRIAQLKHQGGKEKLRLLDHLEKRQTELLKVNAIPRYGLLMVQKEITSTQLETLQAKQEASRWLASYRQTTGLSLLPVSVFETKPSLDMSLDMNPGTALLEHHPALQALDTQWRQHQTMQQLSSSQAEPWALAVSAKEINSAGFTETQLGVGVQLPLTFFKRNAQSHRSEHINAQISYQQQRSELFLALLDEWQQRIQASKSLQQQQTLLAENVSLAKGINVQIQSLSVRNELNPEIIIRRTLDAIDSQAAFSLNQILIHQNRAMLRQAAGVPL